MKSVAQENKLHNVTVQSGECSKNDYGTLVGKKEAWTWTDSTTKIEYHFEAS